MKKTLFALTIASLLSAPALASKEGFYIGADLASNSLDGNSFDTGIGLVAGYDFQVAPQIVIGVEGEYRNFGKDKFTIVQGFWSEELKAHSFGVNIKPKYYFNDNFYAGVQLGLHSVKEEFKESVDGNTFKNSGSDTGLSYGLEAGYDLNSNISIKGGYKAISVEPLGVDADYSTFYIGANYKF